MKEKRNSALTISLAVLTAITAVVFFLQEDHGKVAVDPLLFRITDANVIDHVVLESHGKKYDLHFNGTEWKVNDKFAIDQQLVKVLMATLLQVTPKRPVAKQWLDSVNRRLDSNGTIVSVYAGEVLQKKFTAGGNAAKTEAWFRDEGTASDWIVVIPGYRVYSSGIFELTENEWRDKRVFNFNWRNFRKLTLTYPADPAGSFEIGREGDVLGIAGIDKPDSTRINTFLNDALSLTADRIEGPGIREYDSITKTTPYLTIVVEDVAKRTYRLDLFPPVPKTGKVAGKAIGDEIVVFERKKTFPILKKKDYFRAK